MKTCNVILALLITFILSAGCREFLQNRGDGYRKIDNGDTGQMVSGSTTLSGLTYYNLGKGHWVSKTIDFGKFIQLEDKSLWEISFLDKINTCLWLPIDSITVIENNNTLYPYRIINTSSKESAEAKLISK
ncbi:MAG: hypothetical protein AAB019_06325 [Planctomycetota bacterium]